MCLLYFWELLCNLNSVNVLLLIIFEYLYLKQLLFHISDWTLDKSNDNYVTVDVFTQENPGSQNNTQKILVSFLNFFSVPNYIRTKNPRI